MGNKVGNLSKFKEGMILTEESSGTHAISISILLKKAVYISAKNNYCDFLRKLHFFSTPLYADEKLLGFLAVVGMEESVGKEPIVIAELLDYQITSEFMKVQKQPVMYANSNIKLSKNQLTILKLIALGSTDQALALDTGLSLGTIKYHKKKIFKKLNANCNVAAVVKALKLNLIALEQIPY